MAAIFYRETQEGSVTVVILIKSGYDIMYLLVMMYCMWCERLICDGWEKDFPLLEGWLQA